MCGALGPKWGVRLHNRISILQGKLLGVLHKTVIDQLLRSPTLYFYLILVAALATLQFKLVYNWATKEQELALSPEMVLHGDPKYAGGAMRYDFE